MEILIALAICIVFVAVFRIPIKKVPGLFYVIAILLNIFFLSYMFFDVLPAPLRVLFPYMQRCLLAFGMLAIVMFVGVLPERSKLKQSLLVIRAELSIIGALLAIGHIAHYVSAYILRIFTNPTILAPNLLVSFCVSSALVILLAILTITSFAAVRKRMVPTTWKRIQKLAYVFFGMIYLHVLLILLPISSHVGQKAFTSIIIYTVIMLVYTITRVGAALMARRKRAGRAQENAAVFSKDRA